MSGSGKPGAGGTRRRGILLVEDNPDDVELTLLAFEQNNIHNPVTVVGDGAEALDYLFATGRHAGRDPGELPVLVLLDLNLPKVGGLEVLRRIRQDPRTRLLPVVVLTSSDEEQDLVESYAKGANSYVRKPVDFGAFHEAARQLSLYWLVLNEAPPTPRAPPPAGPPPPAGGADGGGAGGGEGQG